MGGRKNSEKDSAVRTGVPRSARTILIVAVAAILAAGSLTFASTRRSDPVAAPSPELATPSLATESIADSSDPVKDASPDVSAPKPGGPAVSAPTPGAPAAGAPTSGVLETLPTASPRTLGSVELPAGVSTLGLTMAFDVYGWAPNGRDGARRLVVKVVDASSAVAGTLPQGLPGQNILLSLASYEGPSIEKTGRYEGTLEARADDKGRGVLYLLGVESVQ